jgi:hypothetical protein
MSNKEQYEQYLSGLRTPNFKPYEIMYMGASNESLQTNTLPPENLWGNILETLWVLQLLRTYVGIPFRPVSIYRSPKYNQQIGGEPGSWHLKNNAIDFTCKNLDLAWRTLQDWRFVRVFKGGIGLYNTFIHLDTRGYNATWDNRARKMAFDNYDI